MLDNTRPADGSYAITPPHDPRGPIASADQAAWPLRLYSTKEAARAMGVSHRTLEDWRLTGRGPKFMKLGRLVRYRSDDLKAFLKVPLFSNTAEAMGR